MSTASPLVSCRGLIKAYGSGESRTPALRGVDLDVYPGELLLLVGPSGCGKTTLISVIGGMLDADDGECAVLGESLSTMSQTARTRFRGKHIGFVFQTFNLLPALSATENVSVPLLLQGVPRESAQLRACAALDAVGLGTRLEARPTQMSGGQQQRVAIARALVHQPRLLICDEPTSSLDHDTGLSIMRTLREVGQAEGRAVVVVTHDPRIFGFADRIARMDDGRVASLETNNRRDINS